MERIAFVPRRFNGLPLQRNVEVGHGQEVLLALHFKSIVRFMLHDAKQIAAKISEALYGCQGRGDDVPEAIGGHGMERKRTQTARRSAAAAGSAALGIFVAVTQVRNQYPVDSPPVTQVVEARQQ